jgi:pimeloyl-ACP methyl ester carboxylesterase
MRRVLGTALVSALVLAMAACSGHPEPEPPNALLQPCTVGTAAAKCATIPVPEDRASAVGRQIDLHVVVVPAATSHPQPDPIFWLAGGPGVAAATDDAANAVRFFAAANIDRDLVFVDQRGTGDSNKLLCEHGNDPARWADDLGTCLGSIEDDPAAYTTAWAMDDVDQVRATLGYDRINLYGGSYGVTAAEVYLQRHPEHVRSVAIISGTMLDTPIFELFPTSSQRALDKLFARCAADASCNAAYPDLAGDLERVTAQLDAGPVTLAVTNPITNQPVRFTRDDLGPSLHNMLRDARTAVQLPRLLHEAARGDWSGVTQNVKASLRGMDPLVASAPQMWQLMALTIQCHEPWAQLRPGPTQTASEHSYLRLKDVQALSVQPSLCAAVPRPDPAALYAPPVQLPTPMLLINGDLDPQDPPSNVESAHRLYPNSLALVATDESHSMTNSNCLSSIVGRFFQTASTDSLPTDCLTGPGLIWG